MDWERWFFEIDNYDFLKNYFIFIYVRSNINYCNVLDIIKN